MGWSQAKSVRQHLAREDFPEREGYDGPYRGTRKRPTSCGRAGRIFPITGCSCGSKGRNDAKLLVISSQNDEIQRNIRL